MELLKRAERFLEQLTPQERKKFWHLLTQPRLADVWQSSVAHELDPWQREVLSPYAEEWASEEGVFLAVHAPPQEGKSELVSERAPAAALCYNPMARVWLISNNKKHATEFGESVRDLLADDEFLAMFPFGHDARVDPLASGSRFKTAARGRIISNHPSLDTSGLQRGGTVGKGPEKIIIDDPYAAPEEALSKTINDHVWNKWRKGIVGRVKSWTSVLWMYHRYQPDDAMGRLIAMRRQLEERFRKVRFIRLPAVGDKNETGDDPTTCCAIAEKARWESGARKWFRLGSFEPVNKAGKLQGELLSPRREVKEVEATFSEDPELAYGQFQGVPRAAGGDFIRREWLQEAERAPAIDLWVRYWDLATGRGQSKDHIAGVLMGIGPKQEIYILDVVHFREQWGEAGPLVAETMIRDKAWCDRIGATYWAGVEDVFWQDAMILSMLDVCNVEGVQLMPVPGWNKAKKKDEAKPWVLRARYGGFFMVPGSWDMQGYIDELINFDGRETDVDDQVDGTSGCYKLTWMLKGGDRTDERQQTEEREEQNEIDRLLERARADIDREDD